MQVFCGMLARLTQFADVLEDSLQQLAKVLLFQASLYSVWARHAYVMYSSRQHEA